MEKKVGNYLFIAGVVIAVVLGLAASKLPTGAASWLWSFLIVLGLVIGFLNVTGKDTKEFLMVSMALVIVAYAGSSQVNSWEKVEVIGAYLKGVFDSMLMFIVPASVVVGLKEIWALAKGEA